MKTLPLSAAVLLAIGAVQAADAPLMKEGLWSIHTESTSQPDNKTVRSDRSICRNHAYDESVRAMAKTQSAKCKTHIENFSPGKLESESDCIAAGVEIQTKGTTTFNDNAAHSETHTTYNPAFNGSTGMTMIMDQKYAGACPAGVNPGDMINSDGTTRKGMKR